VGEVQNTLNQENGSKSSKIVDFVSRFVFLIIITNLNAKSTILEGLELFFSSNPHLQFSHESDAQK
jgi:hypothetical protein